MDLDCALFQRRKVIFMNQGLVFQFSKDFCQRLEDDQEILFGILLIVEVEYLSNHKTIHVNSKVN